jgi:hypothetical protein
LLLVSKHAQLAADMAGAWTPKNEVQVQQTLSAEETRILINFSAKINLADLPSEQLAELRKSHVPLADQRPLFDPVLRLADNREGPPVPSGEGTTLSPEEAVKLIPTEDRKTD